MVSQREERIHQYSFAEEVVNSATHGVGAFLSVAGLVILIVAAVRYGDVWHLVGFSIFGGSLILLYAASTFYHGFSNPSLKTIFKKMDHSAIFLLIAGTYTPFSFTVLRGALGWSLFGIVWALAIAGITVKFFTIFRFRRLSVVIYLLMGWLGVIAIKDIIHGLPSVSLALLIAGGLAYTAGTFFYLYRRLPFHHAFWHLFVLGGSVSHYLSLLFMLKSD